jgi:lysophospholipase L1-like esterase
MSAPAPAPPPSPEERAAMPERMRLLALGDSYSIGEGVSAAERWPVRLTSALRDAGHVLSDPHIIAATGWTTDELAAAMARASLEPAWALVTLQIGVNDQYRGRSVAALCTGFRPLLARAIELAGGAAQRVLVVSIPDWGVTPFARARGHDVARTGATIDACNAAERALTAAAGAHWVDVTALSRVAGAELAADGLHPAAAQYARWLTALLPAAQAALEAH